VLKWQAFVVSSSNIDGFCTFLHSRHRICDEIISWNLVPPQCVTSRLPCERNVLCRLLNAISQGSVATRVGQKGIFNNHWVGNLLLRVLQWNNSENYSVFDDVTVFGSLTFLWVSSCWEWREYRVAQNKIPQQTICNFSATSCPILKILEAA